MSRFKAAGKGMVGIDISSTAIKLIELRAGRGGPQVMGHGAALLPPGAVLEGRIHDEDAVADALSCALERAAPACLNACVAVPAEAAIVKTLYLPASLDEADIESRLQLDYDKHIPYAFNEVSFDFQPLGPLDEDHDQQAVLLVACRRQTVQQRAALVRRAGLKPSAVDVDTFAVERAMLDVNMGSSPLADDGEERALVDIGGTLSTFHVLHRGRTIYRHDIALGGQALTDEVRDRYGLSPAEAVSAKRQGRLPSDYRSRVLLPFIESLAHQLGRALQLYYTAGQRQEVRHMWLTGGASVLPGLAERLAEESGMRVAVANPLRGVRRHVDVDEHALLEEAPSLLTAFGLALREQG